ncbi:hypothetical protein V0288_19380 [Pannus brasiliensis CCIBt3594]|uniref:Ice-binding protein C-terminal domain-containing protein n=1 Tax=Pannus brasiliensis CCIBt3594 TaxID=1427578 RepID=A0AAW9QY81_9CHRO
MKLRNTLAISATALSLSMAGFAGNAYAGSFTTTLTLSPASVDGINRVVLNFSTNSTTGTINKNGLINWDLELFAGTTSLFRDTVVSGGVLQPSSFGFTRSIDFSFNLDTSTLTTFDNDVFANRINANYVGIFYNAFNISANQLIICKNTNGVAIDDNGPGNCPSSTSTFTQQTQQSQATPEPGSVLALLGLGLGTLAVKGKKQA